MQHLFFYHLQEFLTPAPFCEELSVCDNIKFLFVDFGFFFFFTRTVNKLLGSQLLRILSVQMPRQVFQDRPFDSRYEESINYSLVVCVFVKAVCSRKISFDYQHHLQILQVHGIYWWNLLTTPGWIKNLLFSSLLPKKQKPKALQHYVICHQYIVMVPSGRRTFALFQTSYTSILLMIILHTSIIRFCFLDDRLCYPITCFLGLFTECGL